MLKIEKVLSSTALPLSARQNIANFEIPLEGSHMDMKDSYIQFQMDVQSSQSGRLSFGQDNVPYHPICLVRRARLVSSTKGVISEVYNLNILMENLLWNGRTTADDQADALMGWGAVAGEDYMHSIITDYNGSQNCMVKIPFEHLFPGSLGKEDELPMTDLGDLTIQLELESSRQLFQQAVLPRWTAISSYERNRYTGTFPCAPVTGAPSNTLTTSAGLPAAFYLYLGALVTVSYTVTGQPAASKQVVVTNLAGQVITLSDTIPVSTEVTVAYDNILIHTAPIAGSTGGVSPGVSELTVPLDTAVAAGNLDPDQFTEIIPDLSKGSLPLQVKITFVDYPIAGGAVSDVLTVQAKVTAVTGDGPWTVAFTPALPELALGYNRAGINIQPLNVNVTDAVWSVQQAFAFPYRKLGKAEKVGKRVISTYTQEPLPQVSDGYSFAREVQVSGDAYSCFLLTPPASNSNQLLSVADGVSSYRFFLDDVALSTVPIDIRSTLHLDMLMRVFNNSEFLLKNLSFTKDTPWFIATGPEGEGQKYVPASLVAKMKPKSILDEPNVEGKMERRNLRVEMQGADMATAKTIYFFKEEWKTL